MSRKASRILIGTTILSLCLSIYLLVVFGFTGQEALSQITDVLVKCQKRTVLHKQAIVEGRYSLEFNEMNECFDMKDNKAGDYQIDLDSQVWTNTGGEICSRVEYKLYFVTGKKQKAYIRLGNLETNCSEKGVN